jgi:hypothetical protein
MATDNEKRRRDYAENRKAINEYRKRWRETSAAFAAWKAARASDAPRIRNEGGRKRVRNKELAAIYRRRSEERKLYGEPKTTLPSRPEPPPTSREVLMVAFLQVQESIQALGEAHLSAVKACALEHYPGLNRELITMAVGALWVRGHATVEPGADENDPVVRLV